MNKDLHKPATAVTATTTLTEWAASTGQTVGDIVQAANNGEFHVVNEFLTKLTNKWASLGIIDFLTFESPVLKAFNFGPANPLITMGEYIVNDIVGAEDYDGAQRILTNDALMKQVVYPVAKQFAKRFALTHQDAVVMAAFTTESTALSFMADMMNKFATSFELYMQTTLEAEITSKVKRLKTFTSTDTATTQFAKQQDEMGLMLIELSGWRRPVKTGRAMRDAAGALPADLQHTSTVSFSDMIIFASPEMQKALSVRTASLYHDNKIAVDGLTMVDSYDLPHDELIVLDKRALRAWYRIMQTESQRFAANMKTDTFFHVWGTYGIVDIAAGCRYKLASFADIK